MTHPSLSILVNTAAGREDNLIHCLEQLTHQSDPDFEVIVNDCGSEGGAVRVAPFTERLRLRYDWRPFDLCVSRSRNRGAEMAEGDYLVLIDGDMLLNPEAVAAYREHARSENTAIIGYYGNVPGRVSRSVLQPERQVNYLDKRLILYSRQGVSPLPALRQLPHEYGWSANFGVRREDYLAVGGFDERFLGWGGEDPQFALDLVAHGCELHYALDVWAEHQIHPRFTPFHAQAFAGKAFLLHQYLRPVQPLQMRDPTRQMARLLEHLFSDYFPQDVAMGPDEQSLLAYRQAHYHTQKQCLIPLFAEA